MLIGIIHQNFPNTLLSYNFIVILDANREMQLVKYSLHGGGGQIWVFMSSAVFPIQSRYPETVAGPLQKV